MDQADGFRRAEPVFRIPGQDDRLKKHRRICHLGETEMAWNRQSDG